jgi:hypothetical protein
MKTNANMHCPLIFQHFPHFTASYDTSTPKKLDIFVFCALLFPVTRISPLYTSILFAQNPFAKPEPPNRPNGF